MEDKFTKYVLAAISVVCIILIAVTSFDSTFLSPVRDGVGLVLVPLENGMSRIGSKIAVFIEDEKTADEILKENEELKSRVSALTEENNRLVLENDELSRLRELLQLDAEYMSYDKVAARVIAKDSGRWFNIFRIDKGFADGIRVDANVMADGGLVGIVTEVGTHYATVRAIIDDLSRVSALAQRSMDSCIVYGDLTQYASGRLRFENAEINADIQDGDRIVTSDISSRFLPGLLIGFAEDVEDDPSRMTRSGYIVPAADFNTMKEVLVITDLKNDYLEEGEETMAE